jgi:CO dehydrogenase nickel-insertion accessory protein CooC1
LYLHGEAGTGKTFFVENVLLKTLKKEEEVFLLDSAHLDSKHAFASWNPIYHKAGA